MDNCIQSPFEIAKYFKYMQQFKLDYIIDKQPLNRIQCKSFYVKNKKIFEKAYDIFNKYHLDIYNFIDFYINFFDKSNKTIEKDFLSVNAFNGYQSYLCQQDKNKKIYKWFEKSVENISNDCIAYDFFNVKDYIRHLIVTRKLASYYMTGKISKYWFCGIPGFKKIILKLDNISKDEFMEIYDKFDIYNTEINNAFLYFKNMKVNPIYITEQRIFQKRNVINKSK